MQRSTITLLEYPERIRQYIKPFFFRTLMGLWLIIGVIIFVFTASLIKKHGDIDVSVVKNLLLIECAFITIIGSYMLLKGYITYTLMDGSLDEIEDLAKHNIPFETCLSWHREKEKNVAEQFRNSLSSYANLIILLGLIFSALFLVMMGTNFAGMAGASNANDRAKFMMYVLMLPPKAFALTGTALVYAIIIWSFGLLSSWHISTATLGLEKVEERWACGFEEVDEDSKAKNPLIKDFIDALNEQLVGNLSELPGELKIATASLLENYERLEKLIESSRKRYDEQLNESSSAFETLKSGVISLNELIDQTQELHRNQIAENLQANKILRDFSLSIKNKAKEEIEETFRILNSEATIAAPSVVRHGVEQAMAILQPRLDTILDDIASGIHAASMSAATDIGNLVTIHESLQEKTEHLNSALDNINNTQRALIAVSEKAKDEITTTFNNLRDELSKAAPGLVDASVEQTIAAMQPRFDILLDKLANGSQEALATAMAAWSTRTGEASEELLQVSNNCGVLQEKVLQLSETIEFMDTEWPDLIDKARLNIEAMTQAMKDMDGGAESSFTKAAESLRRTIEDLSEKLALERARRERIEEVVYQYSRHSSKREVN
jgi:hypothetical protein